MFCVVYMIAIRRLTIAPFAWIKDVDWHMPKFLNNGLNKNQTHVLYFSKYAINEIANGGCVCDYRVDFEHKIQANVVDVGCYLIKICKCFRKFFCP